MANADVTPCPVQCPAKLAACQCQTQVSGLARCHITNQRACSTSKLSYQSRGARSLPVPGQCHCMGLWIIGDGPRVETLTQSFTRAWVNSFPTKKTHQLLLHMHAQHG